MKKYILLLLSFISLTAYSQTVSNLPSGAKPYGNQLYIMPSTGDIWSGNAGYKYRVLAKKSYVDSLTTLGYKKTQVDSLLALKASITYVNNEITNTVNYINSALALKENVITATTSADYYRGDKTFATLNKTAVGLPNVDNTSDANKPVSTAQQTALNLKANIASPTFTGTVSGITKAMVGLSNVDNTSDLNKPISTTTQSALDLKINTSLIGANSGVASLDVNGKVPLTQINDALLGAVKYQSSYDASTNTPALPSASSSKGFYYVVSVGGTQQGLTLLNGDWIISNGTIWQKVDNNSFVNSVNGQVGNVNITTITGNAGTATTLETPRTIWGQSFNGSANVTGALTGATTINASSTVTAPTFVGALTGNATTATNSGIWDGGATGLTASTGRTSLGGTTIGQNLFTLTNPSAITFPRFNADNSVSPLSASAFRSAIGTDVAYQPKENQRLSTSDNVTHNNITANNIFGNNFQLSAGGSLVNISGYFMLSNDAGGGQPLIKGAYNADTELSPARNDINNYGDVVIKGGGTEIARVISSSKALQATKFKVTALNTAPSSATDTGTTGEIRITSTHIYVCTATNTWVRSALTTW